MLPSTVHLFVAFEILWVTGENSCPRKLTNTDTDGTSIYGVYFVIIVGAAFPKFSTYFIFYLKNCLVNAWFDPLGFGPRFFGLIRFVFSSCTSLLILIKPV